MKPLLNLDELTEFESHDDGPFGERYAVVSDRIGAKNLGYSVTIVPPGKKVCPFHNHRVTEEMFLILEGSGTLRFGESEYPVRAQDIIACPPGGREVAHQIVNTSDADLRYLCLSTRDHSDICEYPDSNKLQCFVGEPGKRSLRHIFKVDDEVDYLLDEK